MPTSLSDLGARLKAARTARGLSQRGLSLKTGLAQAKISRIENGAVDLRATTLATLAEALDLEIVFAPRSALPAISEAVAAAEPAPPAPPAPTLDRVALAKELSQRIDRLRNGAIKPADARKLDKTLTELRALGVDPGTEDSFRRAAAAFRVAAAAPPEKALKTQSHALVMLMRASERLQDAQFALLEGGQG